MSILRRFALLLPIVVVAGCSEELGPEPMRTTRVRGVVQFGGQPLARGWVEFHPLPGTIGNLRVAQIQPDGSFEVEGVAVGRNVVQIDHASTERRGNEPLVRFKPFARVIPEGSPTILEFDLLNEARRQEKDRPR